MNRTTIVLYNLTKDKMEHNGIDNTMLVNTINSIDAKTAKKAIKAISGKLHLSNEDKQEHCKITINKDTALIKAVDAINYTRSYALNMVIIYFVIDYIKQLKNK